MRKRKLACWIGGAAVAAAVLGGAAGWFVTEPQPAFPESQAATLEQPGDPEHGRLGFAAGDCASCHVRPGQKDRTNLGGGLALASPFGTLRVPNISPDPNDGIGRWRTIDLANALMCGVSPTGEHYYPALPYVSNKQKTNEEKHDQKAYLRTLPPVSGK